MAITEFEPNADVHDLVLDSAPEADEKPPFDIFRDGLHSMVSEIEGQGLSVLSSLLAIREELHDRRRLLMADSLRLEGELRRNFDRSSDVWAQFKSNENELNLVYHKLEWLEGYVRDRQR